MATFAVAGVFTYARIVFWLLWDSETVDKGINGLKKGIEDKILITKSLALTGLRNSKTAANYFESQVVTSLLGNSEYWLGLRSVQQGTPRGTEKWC